MASNRRRVVLWCTFSLACLLPGTAKLRAQDLPAASSSERDANWKSLPKNTLSDQKRIWLFPARLARGHAWKPAAAVVVATAGLGLLDETTGSYFRRSSAFHGLNQVASGRNTELLTAGVPLSLYVAGLIRHDTYAEHTALLAGEAVLDSEIVTTVMKDIDRRLRPAALPPNGDFSETWFRSGANLHGAGSFPSGHSIAAFSIATVIARRYGRHRRWLPYVAYGVAGIVAFSRVTLSAHFPTDVFMGAALGYSISRFAVLRQ
jgi:PAP2 superfamily